MININDWVDCFEQNIFYQKYLQLIELNRETPSDVNTHCHHIIPKCFFKYKGIVIDNSRDNKINLTFCDHLLAHYYLANCTVGKYKYGMQCAMRYLTKGFEYEEIINVIPDWEKEYIKYNRAISEKQKGHIVSDKVRAAVSKAHKGKPAHNKGKPMSQSQKEKLSLIKQGKKRKPHSEETKLKISLGNKNKVISEETRLKLRLANLGTKKSEKTRLKHSLRTSNKRWYTNGIDNIYIDKDITPPEGFISGRTYKRKPVTEEMHIRLSAAAKLREQVKRQRKIQEA